MGFIEQQLLLPFNLMKMPLSNQQVFDKINGVTTIFNVFLIKVAWSDFQEFINNAQKKRIFCETGYNQNGIYS